MAAHRGDRQQSGRLRRTGVSDPVGPVEGAEERLFTVDEARQLLPQVIDLADEIIDVRARLTVARHGEGEPIALADLKALEAQLADSLDRLAAFGVQIKGWAPLLVDFPARYEDRDILLCWLEGERALEWYHDADHGFPGRRRLTDLGW
jgi:hypothetical protein